MLESELGDRGVLMRYEVYVQLYGSPKRVGLTRTLTGAYRRIRVYDSDDQHFMWIWDKLKMRVIHRPEKQPQCVKVDWAKDGV